MAVPIINLTQHNPTPAQMDAGVVPFSSDHRENLKYLLTFDEVPSPKLLRIRAETIVRLLNKAMRECGVGLPSFVMVGGAPFFMGVLEDVLINHGIEPVYAFSVRKSVEITDEQGNVTKQNVFCHEGFVRPHANKFGHKFNPVDEDYL